MKIDTKNMRMPSIGRIALIGAGIAAGTISIIYLSGKIKDWKIKKQGKDLIKQAEQEINPSQLSYPVSTYKSMADNLFTAMRWLGTDEDTIYETLSKIKSQSDWNMLVKEFGYRNEGGRGLSEGFEGNLINWLSAELDANEMKKVRMRLASANVTI